MNSVSNGSVGVARPVPEKIREAREARGHTLESFADCLGVSKQAVAQYETGQAVPSGEIFSLIVREAGQPIGFFTAPKRRSGEPSFPFWRSLKRMELTHRRRIFRRLQWTSDIFDFVNEYVELPKVNFPKNDFSFEELDEDRIEEIAEEVRALWQLGNGPVRHLATTLEENGVVLVRENVACPDMDGVSCWVSGRPFILLSKEVRSGPRDLFNLTHELAHLVLHAGVEVTSDNLSKIERQANRFASAFLLPRAAISREIFGTSISHLTSLKQRWGVAISAVAYRAKDLGIFSADQFSYVMRQMNMLRIKKVEPLDDAFPVSEPQLLRQSMSMIVDHGVCSRAQVESAVALNPRDIESLCNMEPGFLDHRVIQFSFRKDVGGG